MRLDGWLRFFSDYIVAVRPIRYLYDLVAERNGTGYTGYIFVPLTAQADSTDFDGDAHSTAAKTKIDLSAAFGLPAGIKAVYAEVIIRDSGSAGGTAIVVLGPTATADLGPSVVASSQPNDAMIYDHLIIPCDANGDIYYQVYATGASTLDLWIRVWGYYL